MLWEQKVRLGFRWIHRNVDNKSFSKSKNSEENKTMICGLHYFNTRFKKTKLMSSHRVTLSEDFTDRSV